MNTLKAVAWIAIMLIFGLGGTVSANWQRVPIGGGSEPRYLQDVNNDGWVDSISTTRWYKNPGDGTVNWTGFSIGNTDFPFPCGRIVGDVNGDGLPDLVIGVGQNYPAPDRNKIFAFINPGDTGTWTRYHIGTLPDSADGVEAVGIGDMNNDGHPDILAGGESAELRWYVNPGTIRDDWVYHIIHHFRFQRGDRWITTDVEDLLIKDFNNDNFSDVAVATSSPHGCFGSVQVFWNPRIETGNWLRIQLENEAVWASMRSVIRSLAAGDIDQDGRIDIVFANCQPLQATALFWYRNNGASPWTRYTIDILSNEHLKHSRPVVADIDLDGKLDVICFRYDSGATYWYKNPGGGGSWTRIKIYGTALLDQGVGDVDQDGDVDIISAGFWYKNPAR